MWGALDVEPIMLVCHEPSRGKTILYGSERRHV